MVVIRKYCILIKRGINFSVWLLQAQFSLPVAQADHTMSIQVTVALEMDHSQLCPNCDLTITYPEIRSLPWLFPLVTKKEGKNDKNSQEVFAELLFSLPLSLLSHPLPRYMAEDF